MRILLNDNDEIIGYAIVGGLEGDFEVSDEIIPSGFKEDFEPRRFIYSNGAIIYNKNYNSPPVEQQPPNYEQRISELERQMKEIKEYMDNQPQA